MELKDDTDFLLASHRAANRDEIAIATDVFNLELRPKQIEIIKEFFSKAADGKPMYEECMLVCGKKGGKTFLIAVMNLILIYKLILIENFFKHFKIIPQDVFLLNTCAGKNQSRDVYLNQVKGIVTLSPFLQMFKSGATADDIKFKIPNTESNLILKAQSSRSISSLGYLCFSVTFDELAWFHDTNNRITSKDAYDALFPNIKPFEGWGYSFILSSPSDNSSWFYSHYNFSKGSKRKLVKQYATWEMNPNITRESLAEEFRRDPDKATMDWAGKFIEAIGGAFTPEAIDGSLKLDIRDVSVGDKRLRVLSLDPGLKHDAYSLAMGFSDINHRVHIDYVHDWQGTRNDPVRISDVEKHIRYLKEKYPNINKIVLDQRYSASTIQRLGAEGLPIFETFFDGGYKQKMYQTFKEKINMGEVLLPRHEKVRNELIALRRKGSGANIRYEAPTTGLTTHDDMADAIANCIYQLNLLDLEGAGGTDDFALDGKVTHYESETEKKERIAKMPEKEKQRLKEQEAKKGEEQKKALKKIDDDGGFAVG